MTLFDSSIWVGCCVIISLNWKLIDISSLKKRSRAEERRTLKIQKTNLSIILGFAVNIRNFIFYLLTICKIGIEKLKNDRHIKIVGARKRHFSLI